MNREVCSKVVELLDPLPFVDRSKDNEIFIRDTPSPYEEDGDGDFFYIVSPDGSVRWERRNSHGYKDVRGEASLRDIMRCIAGWSKHVGYVKDWSEYMQFVHGELDRLEQSSQ
jgi:hypothetical protein